MKQYLYLLPRQAKTMSTSSFRDDSTECAICLGNFKESPEKDVITFRCGHKYHLDCVIEQIKSGSMTAKNDDQRLLFNSCQCAKCGGILGEDDHPDLPKNLIRSTDKLRLKVNALIDEHNLLTAVKEENYEKGKVDKQVSLETLYRKATHKNAFHLCSYCKIHTLVARSSAPMLFELLRIRLFLKAGSVRHALPNRRSSAKIPPNTDAISSGSAAIAADQRPICVTGTCISETTATTGIQSN